MIDYGKYEKHIIIVSEEQRFDDDFKEPTRYFIINAFGEAVHFKTRSREKAQQWSDEIYGEGFYTIREVQRAILR